MDSFLMPLPTTPAIRKGIKSKVLQRRSLAQRDPLEQNVSFSSPRSTSSILKGHSNSSLILSSTLNQSELLDSTLNQSKPFYTYHSKSTTDKNDADTLLLTTENLFVDFMSSCTDQENDIASILDRIADFETMLDDQVLFIQSTLTKNNSDPRANENISKINTNLKNERNTWRLFGKIFGVISHSNGDMEEQNDNQVLSEKDIIDNLFENSLDVKRAQAVVDWLELNAKTDLPDIDNSYGDALIGWENTLHSLLHTKNNERNLLNRNLVKELDPDSKRRTKGQLHEDDEKDQERLVRMIFMLLRAGMLQKAQELCVRTGQPWRAATLTGWQPYYDPNSGTTLSSGDIEKLPSLGNPRRDIWKKCAWNMSCDGKMPVYERAIYSSLCGNANQLAGSVCQGWEDLLWALCKSMVDILVEKELRTTMPRNYIELPEAYWDNKSCLNDILQTVKSTNNNQIQEEIKSPYRIVQSHIILGEWEELSKSIKEWSETQDPHLLRFLCHLSMCLDYLLPDIPDQKKSKEIIFEKYIEYLMSSNRVEQVAWYTSFLSHTDQIRVFSTFIENIYAPEDRKMCLKLGFNLGLPMQEIRFALVDNIFAASSSSAEESEKFDRKKIQALDWLIDEPKEKEFGLLKGNALIRFFIVEYKLEKANIVLDKIKVLLEDGCDVDENNLRELQCLDLFIKTKEAFGDWFEFYHKGKPRKPDQSEFLNGKNDYTSKVAFDQEMLQYQEQLKRWKDSLLLQSHDVLEHLNHILKFPGGWLETDDIDDEDDVRCQEMNYLRRLCIVDTTFLLHTVLHSTEQYQEAIKIADLISDESTALYMVFSQENIEKLFEKIKESSICLLEQNKDPWGHQKK